MLNCASGSMQADKKLIQLPIYGYIGGPQRENDSGIATDSNNCSRKDSDAGSDTTIHGPIVDLTGFNKSSLNENKDVPNSQQLYRPVHCQITRFFRWPLFPSGKRG